MSIDGQTGLAGPLGCPECGTAMIRDNGTIRCTSCPHTEGVVTYADRLERHRKEMAATVSNYWPAKPRKRRETKAQRVIRQLEQPRLDGIIDPRRPSYRDTERRVAETGGAVRDHVRVVVESRSRCATCDRLYVMAHGKPTCPACGAVDSTSDALAMLLDAFNPPEVP